MIATDAIESVDRFGEVEVVWMLRLDSLSVALIAPMSQHPCQNLCRRCIVQVVCFAFDCILLPEQAIEGLTVFWKTRTLRGSLETWVAGFVRSSMIGKVACGTASMLPSSGLDPNRQ